MSASPEKLGIKLLRALSREKQSGKSLLDCRPLATVASELGFSQTQFDQAVRFLIDKRAIDAVERPDGKAALPSTQGEVLLAAEKDKTAWTFDRRLALYPIIIALLVVLVTLSRCAKT